MAAETEPDPPSLATLSEPPSQPSPRSVAHELTGEQELLEALREEQRLRAVAVAQRIRLSKRVEALQTELTATKAHLRASIAASEHARGELEDLWRSNSWRYTRPLRELTLLVKGALRRGRTGRQSAQQAERSGNPAPVAASAVSILSLTASRVLTELRHAIEAHRH